MKIVKLIAENVKRLQAIEITPDGSLVIIGGQNGAGKTSVLDAIEMALGGAGAIPPEPIHRGKRKARVVADLGDLVVERTFTPKGSALVVRDKDGVEQRSPQALLDSLCSKIAFDPIEFSREDPPKQSATLRKLVGLDFAKLDAERKKAFDERTIINREAKALDARVAALPAPAAGLPDREQTVAELLAELDRRQAVIVENNRQRGAIDKLEDEVAEIDQKGRQLEETITRLEAELAAARSALEGLVGQRSAKAKQLEQTRVALAELVDPDLHEVRTQIGLVEETNRKVRAAAERRALEQKLQELGRVSDELTEHIEDIDHAKKKQLTEAAFPVPGLGFDEAGVTLNGIPLEQASAAEKLRVSVAMGIALNPKLKVLLIRDGSLLDDQSLKLVAELAGAAGAQVWLERVGDRDASAIIIEDGMVREDAPRAGAAE